MQGSPPLQSSRVDALPVLVPVLAIRFWAQLELTRILRVQFSVDLQRRV